MGAGSSPKVNCASVLRSETLFHVSNLIHEGNDHTYHIQVPAALVECVGRLLYIVLTTVRWFNEVSHFSLFDYLSVTVDSHVIVGV